ncbi:MAG: glycine--tRNA ligase subunit beta, partial [SAR324 cluster bacterium]|nr:glycine--tRNA ligase subunit beta [SAR324 cluster bacterium]
VEELQKVQRIAELCKFDLQTQMVYEFPELQGMMGEVYSALKGEESQVSRGIREHYFPRTSGDSLPSDQVTLPVALADRMDMLSVAFSLKMIPSGSADPFALRRMAQGVVQIVLGKQLPLGWKELSSLSVQILRDQQEFTNEPDILEKQLVDFLDQRERWYLQEKGFRHDLIDAVLKPTSGTPLNRLNFASTLSEDLNLPEFKKSVEAVVRAINITNKYAEESQAAKLEEASLTHEAELALYQALEAMALDSESSPQQYLKTLYQLESSITAFFDGVMVMDENPVFRSNRLALCNRLSQWSSMYLDLREILFPGD